MCVYACVRVGIGAYRCGVCVCRCVCVWVGIGVCGMCVGVVCVSVCVRV